MTMFSMKPKFNLAEFLAESAPKKSAEPKTPRARKAKKPLPTPDQDVPLQVRRTQD